MDGARFDALARSLAGGTSRRGFLAATALVWRFWRSAGARASHRNTLVHPYWGWSVEYDPNEW